MLQEQLWEESMLDKRMMSVLSLVTVTPEWSTC